MATNSQLEDRFDKTVAKINAADAAAQAILPDCDLSLDVTFKARYGDDISGIETKIATQSGDIRTRLTAKIGETPQGTERKGKRPILEIHEEMAVLQRAEKLCDDHKKYDFRDGYNSNFTLHLRPGDLLAVCRDGELLLDKLIKVAKAKLSSKSGHYLEYMFNIESSHDPTISDSVDNTETEDPINVMRRQLNKTPLSSQELIDALYVGENYELVEAGFSIEDDDTISFQGVENGDACILLLDERWKFDSWPLVYASGLEPIDLKSHGIYSNLGLAPFLWNTLTNRRLYIGGKAIGPEWAGFEGGCELAQSLFGRSLSGHKAGKQLKVFKVVKKAHT